MNKIYEYMQLGRPIVAALQAPEDPISLSDCGIVTAPEDPESLASAFRTLSSLSEEETLSDWSARAAVCC